MTKAQKATERAAAIERLREWLKPGDTVYTILRHVSRSGMSRSIALVKPDDDDMTDLTWSAAKAGVGSGLDRDRGGVKMGGCGMDMGFALVYELSHVLFPDGFGCIGKGCPSNDHSNGDRDYRPHDVAVENHHWHRSGGYALRHRWL